MFVLPAVHAAWLALPPAAKGQGERAIAAAHAFSSVARLWCVRVCVVNVCSRAHRIFTLLTTFTRATGPVVRVGGDPVFTPRVRRLA